MAEYIEREKVLALSEDFEALIYDGADEIFFEYIPIDKVKTLPAADVLPRDEAITMGAELAAMHGSNATSQQLEEAYLKGVEDGMTRRDVRPVAHGKWIFCGGTWEGANILKCSECGATVYYEERNFCPNCGADMREES